MKGYCIIRLAVALIMLLCPFMEVPAQSPVIIDHIDSLDQHARSFYGINADSAFFYSRKALDESRRNGYKKGEAESWRMMGNTYEMLGDYQQMLSCYDQSRAIARSIGNATLIDRVNVNIALFYSQMGQYDEALKDMGSIVSLYKGKGDSTEQAYTFSYLADVSLRAGQHEQALDYARHALTIATTLNDSLSMADFNDALGNILAADKDYPEAMKRHLQSLAYYQRRDDKLGMAVTSNSLARTSLLMKDQAAALRYANQAMDLAASLRRMKEMKDASQVLSGIYEAKGDYREALHYARLYKDYSDSLFNERTRKQTIANEASAEFERKSDSLRRMEEKRVALQHNIDRNHTLQIMIAVLLIIFLTVVAFVLLREKRISKRNHELLYEKNKEIEQQKEAMEHQAVQLLLNNQEKDKLFSIIAHDLRGPLNSLKGLMDFLKENRLSETEARSMIAELQKNVDYSSELVGNLLFWASSQLDGITATPVNLCMHQLVNDACYLFSKQAGEKNLTLKNEVDATLKAYADKDMIMVIIRNLISNAIKFCRSGDLITVSGRRIGTSIEICVADTGIGIKEDVLNKIRKKESVTTYGTAKEKGTGLGMLLCREFAEVNKGSFRIDSVWEKGSSLYFTIPASDSSSSINV